MSRRYIDNRFIAGSLSVLLILGLIVVFWRH